MNLVLLRCMLAISGRSFSARNNWKHKSYLQHEEPYMKPSSEHITRPWPWYQDDTPHPQLPPATSCGWNKGDRLVPIPTKDPPAPDAVTHVIKCGCKKTSCRPHCSCRSQGLNCSEMCACGADKDLCSNISQALLGIEEDGHCFYTMSPVSGNIIRPFLYDGIVRHQQYLM